MNPQQTPFALYILLLAFCISGCNQPTKQNDYLIKVCDPISDRCGYVNQKGDTVIATGKYSYCFTDTFIYYAFVVKGDSGIVAIDRQENVLYQVFNFDNGPDEPSEGLFRITGNQKIGYADSTTGEVVIPLQFDCAFPFVNGVAQVSTDCKTTSDGEHTTWLSNNWYFIDKRGKKVNAPKAVNE
jgi:hypothetical protein